MRKLAVFALILAPSILTGQAGRADLVISISSPTDLNNLAVGATATFDISVSGTGADAPGYLSASIQYDATVLGGPAVTPGPIIPDTSGFDSSATGGGTVSAYYDDSIFGTAPITSDGLLYSFTLIRLDGDATTLDFSAYSAQDDAGSNISISTSPDSISIAAVSSVPEPPAWLLGAIAMASIGVYRHVRSAVRKAER